MKKLLMAVLLLAPCLAGVAQENYWQQRTDFTIAVTLHDDDNTLSGFETIRYTNNSPDTLHFIWFHVWMNAYKNDRTAFSEQLLQDGRTDFYFSKPQQKGYINQLNFAVEGQTASIETDSANIDIIKVVLPTPLPPGAGTSITTPFRVQLPYNFSRGGHTGHDYQATQWFPKPAVYDQKGWHPMPYLDRGEFFSEFGDFDVEITAPAAYTIAATGQLQDSLLLQQLLTGSRGTTSEKTITWHYKQPMVHDFAWFGSKNFVVNHDTAIIAGKSVDLFIYHKPKAKGWGKALSIAKDGLKKYSGWIGPYPYATASVVQGEESQSGTGMEYPTIAYISTADTGLLLAESILHEVGHNWFYGALASNERDHPWMDEGLNSFYEARWRHEREPKKSKKTGEGKLPDYLEQPVFDAQAKAGADQPIETKSVDFTALNYGVITYYKTNEWLMNLERKIGRTTFDSAMHRYYRQWQNRHPYPADFKTSFQQSVPQDLSPVFQQLSTTGRIDTLHDRKPKLSLFYNLRNTRRYNYINIGPAIGFNNYDKFMIGGFIHNYQLPLNDISFAGALLYGTGSKQLNYIGTVSYTYHKNPKFSLVPGVSVARFSTDFTLDQDYLKIYRGFTRLAPFVRLDFTPSKPGSTLKKWIEWRSYFIGENTFDFSRRQAPQDTLDYYASKGATAHRAVHQLSLGIANSRVLYPYQAVARVQRLGDIFRLSVTGNYYLNYSKDQGVSLRVFAGKIFYTKPKTATTAYENSRYDLTMYGPNGDDDYTYSNTFIDRNQSTGFFGRQVMIRDGGFKYRSDYSSEQPGRTNDWLTALNLSADIPTAINPLQVLPFRVPLKVFADVGTYADVWKANSADPRFLYSVGLQLPVLKYINFYCVLFQSSAFKSPNQNNGDKWWQKRVTFSIDVQNIKGEVKGLKFW